MKRTPLKRKTPLRAKSGFKTRKPLKRTSATKSKKKRTTKPKQPSLRLLKKKLWAECKRIVRKRNGNDDGTFTCYTCGAHLDTPSKAQTGHFIPSSICSAAMRYDLDNLRVQCYRCNINLSGNWIEYEKRLLIEGIDTTELKQRNEDSKNKQYDRLWYQEMIEKYKTL